MLSPLQAPAAARFLLEVAREGRCQLSSFDWGPATGFPFLPRVQRGRVVLALAQWRVDPAAGELAAAPAGGFAAALAAWRERWSVPRHVYLAVADNRLLLDLDDPEHVELLREELGGLTEGRSALLQEALPGPAEAWLPGPDGGHITELVVPVTARRSRQPAASAEAAHAHTSPVAPGLRLRLPGSDWLYLKLYGPRPFEDELIAGPLASLCEFATGAGLSDGWFFLRYADPDPHLRVRFHGEPAALLGPLLRQVCDWAADLVADGVCTRFAFDTYEREVERYGGDDGLRAAEAIFAADSPAVAGMLRLVRQGGLPFDITTLAALSIDDLLESLGLAAGERARLYREAACRAGTPARNTVTARISCASSSAAPARSPGRREASRWPSCSPRAARPSARRPPFSAPSSATAVSTARARSFAAATSTCTPTGFSVRTCNMSSLSCSCSRVPVKGYAELQSSSAQRDRMTRLACPAAPRAAMGAGWPTPGRIRIGSVRLTRRRASCAFWLPPLEGHGSHSTTPIWSIDSIDRILLSQDR